MVLAVGGFDGDGNYVSTVERYDAASDAWREEVSPLPETRSEFGTCEMGGELLM